MPTVVDLLRQLAHDVAPDDDVLRGPLTLPPRHLSPFTLDLRDGLCANWTGAFGRPTTAQHALALAATRAGEAIAFAGGDALPTEDLLLLVLTQLQHAHTTALWLVPDGSAAQRAARVIRQMEGRTSVRWLLLQDAPARPSFVQLIVATYDELHGRLLPYADRAWRWFWRDLHTIAMSDLERANGLPVVHLRWLLRRATRLSVRQPLLVGASAPLAGGAVVLQSLWGRACRIVDSTVGPPEATLVMLWRCEDRYAALDQLAKNLRSRGLSIAVVGRNERDDQVLRARFGAMGVAALDGGARAAIALVSGVPRDLGSREALLRCGYRLVVMLAGDEPHEVLYANDIEQLVTNPPALLAASDNPFVANYHLQLAAAELPLEPAEIERWHVAERVEVLVNKQRLRILNDGALQPSDAAVEPGTTLRAATSNDTFVDVRDPLGAVIASLRPAVADWRGLPGSTWAGDLVVAHRADDPPMIDLAVDERRRLARAVTTYNINPRTKLETRESVVGDQTVSVTFWNAEIRQRVGGLEEHTVDRPPVAPRIAIPLEARWVAHACAIELSTPPPASHGVGWSLKEALLIRTYCASEDLVVTYDAPSQSLWLIETAPGGTGITDWLVEHVADMLTLSLAIARGCEANDLLRALATEERAWLEALIDPAAMRISEQPPIRTALAVREQEAVHEQDIAELVQSNAPPVQMTPSARSRVYTASRMPALPTSTEQQPVAKESEQPTHVGAGPRVYEETEGSHVSSASQYVVEHEGLVEATGVVEDYTFPTSGELPVSMSNDGGNSRIYDAHEARTQSPTRTDEPALVVRKPTNDTDTVVSSVDDGALVDHDTPVWEAVAPSEVPFAASPPASSASTDEAAWRLDDSAPEVEDVRWASVDPTHEIDDITWEPNHASQLPLDESARDIPPLGRESSALNAPRQSRYERTRNAVTPGRTEDRTAQTPPKQAANERDVPKRTGQEPPRPARSAPSPPANQSQPDNRGQNERRNEPIRAQRTTGARPERPAARGETPPQRPVRSGDNERTRTPPERVPPLAERTPSPPEPKEAEQPVNVGSLIARMRRLREERENTQAQNVTAAAPRQPDEDVPLRFRTGQAVRCVPYGEGVVQSSRVVDGREQVIVRFPEIGTLEVDPDINFVRVITAPAPPQNPEDED